MGGRRTIRTNLALVSLANREREHRGQLRGSHLSNNLDQPSLEKPCR